MSTRMFRLRKDTVSVSGPGLHLSDGSRVAVIGGGPAGSLFSYFLLDMADLAGIKISLDIYEPKEFSLSGHAGCNKCGGVISESLIQMLAMDGIFLPPTVVQQGIDTYILHTDKGSAHMKSARAKEKRIASVRRGAVPAVGRGELNGVEEDEEHRDCREPHPRLRSGLAPRPRPARFGPQDSHS